MTRCCRLTTFIERICVPEEGQWSKNGPIPIPNAEWAGCNFGGQFMAKIINLLHVLAAGHTKQYAVHSRSTAGIA